MYNNRERDILNTNDLTDDEKRSIIGQQIDLSEEELKHGDKIPYNDDKLLYREIGLIYYCNKKKFGGHFDKDGYVQDGLKNENGIFHTVRRNKLIYSLCKKCEIPAGYDIDHKNNIRHDNSISNLRKMTHEENVQKAKNKPVVAYNKITGEKVTEYPSAQIAANELGIRFQGISDSCLQRKPSAGDFIWRFASEHIDKIDITEIYETRPYKSKSHAA